MENLNVQKGKLFNFEKTYLNRKWNANNKFVPFLIPWGVTVELFPTENSTRFIVFHAVLQVWCIDQNNSK